MSDIFQCGDNPTLVGYIYGECEPAERRAIEQHLRICPACAAEVEALGATRSQLAAWRPPEAQLGFRMVSDVAFDSAQAGPFGSAQARPSDVTSVPPNVVGLAPSVVQGPARWWARSIPAWAQVAAAVLIFASGLSLGVWRGTASGVPAPAVATSVPAGAVSVSELAALEQRLRTEIESMRPSVTPVAAVPVPAASPSEAQILARVRALIDESEQRQQRELALRTAQVVRDFDSQRRVDLQNVRSIVGQVEGSTGAEIARQQQTLQDPDASFAAAIGNFELK